MNTDLNNKVKVRTQTIEVKVLTSEAFVFGGLVNTEDIIDEGVVWKCLRLIKVPRYKSDAESVFIGKFKLNVGDDFLRLYVKESDVSIVNSIVNVIRPVCWTYAELQAKKDNVDRKRTKKSKKKWYQFWK